MIKHRFWSSDMLLGAGVAMNLKQHASTYTLQQYIPLAGLQDLMISTKVVQVGTASAGALKITARVLDGPLGNASGIVLLDSADILTSVVSFNATAATFYRTLAIALGQPTAVASANGGTALTGLGTILRGGGLLELKYVMTADSDAGTSASGYVNIGASYSK